MLVKKRNGDIQKFDLMKILIAVTRAANDILNNDEICELQNELADIIYLRFEEVFHDDIVFTVDDVHEIVFNELLDINSDVAISYYEYNREKIFANRKSPLETKLEKLNNKDDEIAKANANKDINQNNIKLMVTAGIVNEANLENDLPEELLNLHKDKIVYYHDCVDEDTEYFNGFEWRKISEYVDGDRVLQYNEDGTAELVIPNAYIKEENNSEFYNFNNWTIDYNVSSNHNNVYYDKNTNSIIKLRAKDVYNIRNIKNDIGYYHITTFNNFKRCDFNIDKKLLKLNIAIQADGTVNSFNEANNIAQITISLTRMRKVERLKEILLGLDIDFTEVVKERAKENHRRTLHVFYLRVPKDKYLLSWDKYKNFNNELLFISNDLKDVFLSEILKWDGNISKKGQKKYCTTNKYNADIVQLLSHSVGQYARISERNYDERYKPLYEVCFNKIINYSPNPANKIYNQKLNNTYDFKLKMFKEQYSINKPKFKYCFNLSSGMWVSRRNNKIVITWNCDYYMQGIHNCALLDIERIFKTGFEFNGVFIEPPKSLETAVTLASQVVGASGALQFGWLTVGEIDKLFAPYAEMTYQKKLNEIKELPLVNYATNAEIYQKQAKLQVEKIIYNAMQTFEYQINSFAGNSGSTPFISISFGLSTPRNEYSADWGKLIQEKYLEVRKLGMGKERKTAIFPKIFYILKDGHNLKPADPYYDVKLQALECTAERIYPDYIMYDMYRKIIGIPDEVPTIPTPMGCRSVLNHKENEGWNGRANAGVVSLNLPHLTYLFCEDYYNEENYLKPFRALKQFLEFYLYKAKQMLDFKYETLISGTTKNAPLLYETGLLGGPFDTIEEYFANKRGTLSLGYVGIAEAYTIFTTFINTQLTLQEFSFEMVKFLKEKTTEWNLQEPKKPAYGLYGTPAEVLAGKMFKADIEKFPVLKTILDKKETDEYYTNSFHQAPEVKNSVFDRIDFEAPNAYYSNSGFMHYVELPHLQRNIKALEAVINYAYENLGLFGVNVAVDKCYECGYIGEIDAAHHPRCPQCGNDKPNRLQIVKRISGYLADYTLRPTNAAKTKEFNDRVEQDLF